MSSKSEERVLVVERATHFSGAWPQGLARMSPAFSRATLGAFERSARFVRRESAETDPSLKQLIPYCAIRSRDRILCVERLRTQGETRLHGCLSVGLGGHINPVDASDTGSPADGAVQGASPSEGIIRRALARELHEELSLPPTVRVDAARMIGLINDDATDVGSVHVGLAFVLEVSEADALEIQVREISKMRGTFRRLVGSDGVWQDPPLLESWSRYLVGGFVVDTADSEPRTHMEGD